MGEIDKHNLSGIFNISSIGEIDKHNLFGIFNISSIGSLINVTNFNSKSGRVANFKSLHGKSNSYKK